MSWPFGDNFITKQKNNLRISWILSDHATFGRIVGVPLGKAINMIALNRQISQLCLQFKQQQTSIVQVVELCRIQNYFDWMDCPIFHRYQIVVLTNKSICEKKVAFMCKLFKATRAGRTCKFLTQSLFDLRSHKAVFYRHYPSQRAINGRRLNFMKPLAFSY